MLKKTTVYTLLFVFLPVAGAAQNGFLDNDGVARLIRSGIGDEMVVRVIQSQPGNYFISAQALSALRGMGASDQVIAAMMNAGNYRAAGSNPASSTPAFSNPPVLNPAVQQPYAPVPTVQEAGPDLILRDGTPIRIRLNRTLSSEDAQAGQKVDFDVIDDIRVDNQNVIRRGTKAIGVITEAEHKKRMARGGKLNLIMEYIRLDDGTKVALRASKESAGGGHAGAMTAGMIATSLVAWPAAPLFLMMHGKSAVIPEATEITAYVDGDVRISGAGAAPFRTSAERPTTLPGETNEAKTALVDIPRNSDVSRRLR